jgi:flavin reductase (DIM6/NTAB) family NADH-FMN oxidoreductase RutF
MEEDERASIVPVSTAAPVWAKFFTVAPLVLVGTRRPDGVHDLAPKHMAMPLGWQNYFCFACTPSHETYRNAVASGAFTVSFPGPDQVVAASLAAAPRGDAATKPSLAALPTFPAREVDGVLVEGCYLFLECCLNRVLDGFGEASLVIGEVVAASVDERALRMDDRDDNELIHDRPMLAYLPPGRFAAVDRSYSFPFPVDFSV